MGIDRPVILNQGSAAPPGLENFPMDLPDPQMETRIKEWQPDLLIHAAAPSSVSFSVANPLGDFIGSAYLFFHLLDAVRRSAPDCKVIFLSSAAVYGNPSRLPVSEHAGIRPVSPYGYHKSLCEQIAAEFHHLYGIRICSVRIFSAYGPGLMRQVMWDICKKAVNDPSVELMGTGEESRDFVHVSDIAQALRSVALHADFNAEAYNLGNGLETTIGELASLIVQTLGGKSPITFTGEQREGDPLRWRADIAKLSALGYRHQMPLDKGIRDYVEWALPHLKKARISD